MEFVITDPVKNIYTEVIINHPGREPLHWNIDSYKRIRAFNTEKMFANINGYVASLPVSKQDGVFDIFLTISEAFKSINELHRLNIAIERQLIQLYEILQFNELKKWLLFHGEVFSPIELKTEHGENVTDLTRELTYLKEDHYDLVVLSILLKPMLPVFGQYIDHTKKEVGVIFKEYYAFGLITKTPVVALPAYKRLVNYINSLSKNEISKKSRGYSTNSAIFSGLGSEELPTWLLARTIVRRIVIHEEHSNASLITRVCEVTQQQLSGLDKTFGGRLGTKPFFDDERDKSSWAENYNVKQQISDGDLSLITHYLKNSERVLVRIDPTCHTDIAAACHEIFHPLSQNYFSQHHHTIAQWVLARAIPPRSIPLLHRPSLLTAFSITQALLWHWGFYEIALLMGAQPIDETQYSHVSVNVKILKKHVEEFIALYPHYRLATKSMSAPRNTNVATKAINIVSSGLMLNDWCVYAPIDLLNHFGYKENGVRHMVTVEIIKELSELIIKLTELEKLHAGDALHV